MPARYVMQMWQLLMGLAIVAASRRELPVLPPLVPGSTAIDDSDRHRSPRSYAATLDFYRRVLHQPGSVRWTTIANQPSLRARHVESLQRRTRWQGLNIYEIDGEVFIYVLMRKDTEGT